MLLTSFVARLCIFSIAIMSFLYTADHTDGACSKCGRTNDLYKFMNISLSKYVTVLNMSLRFLFASLILEFICSLNFKDLSIMTPTLSQSPLFRQVLIPDLSSLSRFGSYHEVLSACACAF